MCKFKCGTGFVLAQLFLGSVFGATVQGLVTGGGLPVQGVDVDVFDASTGVEIPIALGDTTDIDGTFSFILDPGTYDFHYSPPFSTGWAGRIVSDVVISGDQTLPEVFLAAGYRVQFTAVTVGGQPVQGVQARFEDNGSADVFTPGNSSDATGLVQTVVPTVGGPFFLTLRDFSGNGFADKSFQGIDLTGDVNWGPIIVGPAQPFVGRVIRYDNSSPVSGVNVDLIDESGLELMLSNDLTDGLGLFSLSGVSDGRYIVYFRPQAATGLVRRAFRKVSISSPYDIGDVVLGIPLQISGRVVTASLTPVMDADINIIDQSYDLEIELSGDNTASDGTFDIEVTNGTFTLIVRPPAASGLAPKTLFDIPLSANVNLGDIVLGDEILLSGRITDSSGQPVANANLDILVPSTQQEIFVANNESDALGDYTVGLESGTWTLKFKPPAGRPDLAPLVISDYVINANTTLDVVLPNAFSSVSSWGFYR